MSTFIKTKLKAARECIQKKDFAKARDATEEILSYEPEHYNANVFLGLALLELGELDLSEQAYQRAIKTSPGQALAWQGLAKFYEQTGRWDKYVETLRKMMDIFAQSEDVIKCAETLQKYIEFRRQRGSRKEIIDALHLLLPSSPLHAALSVLPAPDPTAPTATTTLPTQAAVHNSLPTLEEIVALTEKEEEEAVEREVEKRRMRLDSAGVSPEAVRKEVGLKIWEISKLPSLYGEILNHVYTSDDLRRATEAKLLRYKHRYRCALAPSGDAGALKLKIGEEVQSLIEGVVLLGISDELAWTLLIEGKDVDSVEGYGFDILRRFVKLFPDVLLSLAIRGYFLYNGLPLSEEEEEDEEDVKQEEDNADPFDVLLEAVAGLPESILAHRMLCDIYVHEEDHQNCISAAEKGLHLVRHSEVDTGKKLTQVRKAFNISLATGLVHLFPPKHHARAIRVLDDVLSFEPDNAPCLMSRGFVKQSARSWADAAELFRKVAVQLPDDVNMGLVAEEERAWCLAEEGELDVAVEELQNVLDKLEELDGYEERKARVWWRIGVCYWRLGGASREKSYRHFITSLKRSPSFAPAFTALGVYYLEFSSPPDPTRATKCFQKAFELDARETDAARRLAHSFAEEREWDLVEVVARRTIEGEGGLGGGLGDVEASAIAKHKPTNAWAWKALGVVELNQRSFPAAIQAFQVALRSDENDALSWLRLGEAYAKAGRHAAALKALNKSHELQPGDWMCMYHIGDVQRQTGLLPQAITTFTEVLEKTPNETVVLLALAETHVALGRLELETGYLGRSSASFLLAIVTSLDLVECSPGFRRLALKTIVDALFALSEFSSLVDEELALKAFGRVASLHSDKADDRIAGVVDWPLMQESGLIALALKLAVATCSYRLTLFAKDEDGVGSARFDLSVGLARISASSLSDKIKENAEKQAIESVRLALIAEPGNPMFWNAFGNFNFVSRPMIAQHAYIKALEINNKDVAVWANLGLLYLQNEDLVLANEAFLKAQTLDPDYTLAWVGQGLVASRNGHEDDASTLFEHAVGLTADLPEADIEYAYRMFRKLPRLASRAAGLSQEMLLPPFFALDRYCRRMPRDSSALHLLGLVCERLHLYELGAEVTTRAIKHLEAAYEETEDSVIERRYAIANTNLGRLLLATGNFSAAVETFETAFGLLPAEDDSAETVALRAMCQFGSGIAQFQLGSFDEALVLFESAQEIANSYPLIHGQVTVLLAQILWAVGTDEFRESAKEQLLECINSDPENLAAVVALAAMGLLTGDEALIDAALSEILSLPLDERHRRDPERYAENLLTNHYLAEANTPKALAIAQRAVYTEPSRPEACYNLSSLLVCEGRPEIAQALLSRLLESPRIYSESGLHRSLQLLAIASVASGGGWAAQAEARKIAQRAIVLAPWDSKNWLALAHVQNTPNHQWKIEV
ncbi:TPR-like protein [Phellopilus nigrolimitatus]|nr:TPR-like protein [Phellopilus nigrolimitatus]